jgi:hypothetical protein
MKKYYLEKIQQLIINLRIAAFDNPWLPKIKRWMPGIYKTMILFLLFGILLTNSRTFEIQQIIQQQPEVATTDTIVIRNESGELSKALTQYTIDVCKLYDLDPNWMFAIMATNEFNPDKTLVADDGITRYGICSIHPDIIGTAKEKFDFKVDLVESAYSNIFVGIDRLAWALEKNDSVQGALMVYFYTKPEAQKLWNKNIRTTEWVETVITEYKNL